LVETRKLYHNNPYLRSFNAIVTKSVGNVLELDQTAFYPAGGGQVGDTGVIGGIRVVDTQKDNGTIQHILEVSTNFTVGDKVEGEIDWNRRYLIMKLHSAAHIMEYFLWKHIGIIDRLGSRVDEKKDRADYLYDGRLPSEEIKNAEKDTNLFLAQNNVITIQPDPVNPEIKIWKCGPIEMPCGGTHVKNTTEIGTIKLKRKNPGKGVERIETTLS
jgi:alanyl-tRNA synthetase